MTLAQAIALDKVASEVILNYMACICGNKFYSLRINCGTDVSSSALGCLYLITYGYSSSMKVENGNIIFSIT